MSVRLSSTQFQSVSGEKDELLLPHTHTQTNYHLNNTQRGGGRRLLSSPGHQPIPGHGTPRRQGEKVVNSGNSCRTVTISITWPGTLFV